MNYKAIRIDTLDALDQVWILVEHWFFFLALLCNHDQILLLELNDRVKAVHSDVLLDNVHVMDSA